MQSIIKEAPEVAKAFFSLTENITAYSAVDLKVKELILIGIFTASGGFRGVQTHVERALEHGAAKEEILSAILLGLPVIGVPNVNLAMEKALEIIEGASQKKDEINRS